MSTNQQITPEAIKECRIALGLTQDQAAVMLGYSSKTRISVVEYGKRNPSDSVLRLLAAYMAGYRPDDWPES